MGSSSDTFRFFKFSGSLFSNVGRRRFPWKDCQLCPHALVWNHQHDILCILGGTQLSWKCTDLYDGVHLVRFETFIRVFLQSFLLCVSLISKSIPILRGRRNEDVKMSFLGFFTFNAPYIPWVMLTFSVLLGNSVATDLIGIAVGHMYYFLEYVYPVLAETRGWPIKRLLEPPALLHWVCGSYQQEEVRAHAHLD